ncbi:MAG TPA: CNNM domain-containing protein, partial [Marmoricola sp.]|nr:CNNM domain-containing protein [Marmoricola sp.]
MPVDALATGQWLVGAIVLLSLTAVLALVDSALASYSRAHAQELAEEGRAGAKRLLVLLEDPPSFTGTISLLRVV